MLTYQATRGSIPIKRAQAVAEARQARARPHAAMPYADVPAFVAELRQRPATAARALEFCILTAARGNTARGTYGSNPSRSATIFLVEITYEFAFLQVEFSPLSRGLRELNL